MSLTPNVVANTPILSTWGNEVRDRSVQVFATAAERASQWPTPPKGATSWLNDTNTVHVYNGTAWVCVTPVAATVPANDTAGTSYADGATPGPTVSIFTGTRALVNLSCNMNNSGGVSAVFMAYAVTGATTIAPTDLESLGFVGPAGSVIGASYESYITNLTPGLNTFTAKYRAATGTISFALRKLRVTAIP